MRNGAADTFLWAQMTTKLSFTQSKGNLWHAPQKTMTNINIKVPVWRSSVPS